MASDGRVLRGGGTDPRPRRRPLPPHRHPPAAPACSRSGMGDKVIARTDRPQVLFESGFGPRWYVPREDIRQIELTPVEGETFCPYKGLASYYDIGEAKRAAWSTPRRTTRSGGSATGSRSSPTGRGLPRRRAAPPRARPDRPASTALTAGWTRPRSSRPAGNGPAERRGEGKMKTLTRRGRGIEIGHGPDMARLLAETSRRGHRRDIRAGRRLRRDPGVRAPGRHGEAAEAPRTPLRWS